MKLLIVFTAALILEVASTYYIASVAKNSPKMIAWAFVGPFLLLPFYGYLVDSSEWSERLFMALFSGLGYAAGSAVVHLIQKRK